MIPFKFFSNNEIPFTQRIEFLKEYHRRLDYRYVSHYQIFATDNPFYNQTADIFRRTLNYINIHRLTSCEQINRYVYFSYRDMVQGVMDEYKVNRLVHDEIILDVFNFLRPN